MLIWRGAWIVLLFLFSTHAWAFGKKQKTYLMGVMGDSLSAATFADTSVDIPGIQGLFRGSLENKPVQAEFLVTNKKNFSWSSGEKIHSHYLYLKDWMEMRGELLSVANVSFPGDKAKHLKRQAEQISEEVRTQKYLSLKYVTFMIGANDACAEDSPVGTPNEKMAEQLKSAFGVLAQIYQEERIKVLVSVIPKIPELGRKDVMETRTLGFLTCEQMRNEIMKYCNSITVWHSQEEYEKHLQVVIEKNLLIEKVVQEMSAEYPQLDLHLSHRFYEADIHPEELAADCFHPNQNGQERISNELWLDQPWFR